MCVSAPVRLPVCHGAGRVVSSAPLAAPTFLRCRSALSQDARHATLALRMHAAEELVAQWGGHMRASASGGVDRSLACEGRRGRDAPPRCCVSAFRRHCSEIQSSRPRNPIPHSNQQARASTSNQGTSQSVGPQTLTSIASLEGAPRSQRSSGTGPADHVPRVEIGVYYARALARLACGPRHRLRARWKKEGEQCASCGGVRGVRLDIPAPSPLSGKRALVPPAGGIRHARAPRSSTAREDGPMGCVHGRDALIADRIARRAGRARAPVAHARTAGSLVAHEALLLPFARALERG